MKKYILNIIAATALLLSFSGSIFAQYTVRGFVKSGSGGTPMVGVTITIKGTATGTITDASGNYFISVTSGVQLTLVATYVGYSPIEKTLTPNLGNNWMNFWFNPPALPSDYDGNYYHTVVIGTQTWMGENLLVTHFRDGTNILNVIDNTQWINSISPEYCWYNNDYSTYKGTYGALYNWYTVNTGNLCPIGWHVPASAEWTTLTTFLGGESVAGGHLKEAGYSHWASPNTGADNSTGFTALPGASRNYNEDGSFSGITIQGYWWSSTIANSTISVARYMGSGFGGAQNVNRSNNSGLSVRCLQNTTPILTSTSASSISQNTAQSGGNITSDGGDPVTARGVCWSTSSNPTTANSHTSDGTGTGSFTSLLTGLIANTTYYVRAYATNSLGTSYGNNLSFTTCPNTVATVSGTTSVCLNFANPNITFTGTNGAAPYTFTYRINTGGNLTATTSSVSSSVTVAVPTNTAGTFTYYLLSAYDVRGSSCAQAQSGSATVTVIPSNTITLTSAGSTTSQIGCINNAITPITYTTTGATGANVTSLPSGITGVWSGNVVTISGTPTVAVGAHTYTVTLTGGCGAVNAYGTIGVTPQPTAYISYTGSPWCRSAGVQNVTLIGTTGGTFSAPAGLIIDPSTGAITPNASTAGTYTVTYTIAAAGGCGVVTATTSVTITALPIATFSYLGTPYCSNTANPTPTFSGGGVAGTFSSTAGLVFVNPATGQIDLSASTPGTYIVTNTIAASGGCGAVNATGTITVNALPEPTITGTASACAGSTGNVYTTEPGMAGYIWVVSAGGTITSGGGSGNNTVIVTWATSGAQTVSVNYTNFNGCTASTPNTYNVTVNALPTAPTVGTITQPTCAVATGSVVLNGLPATGSWTLTRTPGSVTTPGSGTSETISTLSADTYTYTVTNANGCISPPSPAIVISAQPATPAAPTITASGPTTFCAGGNVTLTSSVGTSYLWSNAATTSSIIVTTSGSYSVLVTNASGCQSVTSAATIVTVNALPPAPTISAGGPTTFCTGGSVTLTSSAGTTYLWSNGATTSSINVTTAGSYTVQVTNASGCQSAASAATIVTVNALPPAPTISAGGPTTFCAGGSVTLTSSAGTTYLWSNGATTSSINVTTAGSYTVQVTNASGCQSTASAATIVTVNALPPAPTISAGGPTTFCTGGSVTLTSSAGTTYLWSNGATTSSINVTTAGSYTVQVTNASGCQSAASAATIVTVNALPPAPTISAGGPTTFCAGGSVTLTSSAGTTYLWSNGATTSSINVTTAGSYTVQVTNASGCQSAASAATVVTVNALPPAPTISAGGPTTFCTGGSVTLTSSAGTTYLWSNGATTSSINVTTAGSYTVQVTNASGCQSAASAATVVTVNALPPAPTISAGGPTTFCTGGSVTLTSSAGTTYLWSNGATTSSINVTTAGSYTVQVTNASGCQSAASAATVVTVNALPTPTLASSDTDNTICSGSSVTFTAGGGTNYNFRVGGITVQTGPSSVYTTSSLTNGQVVDVIVTNGTGCMATSSPITNTVNSLPSISVTTPAACSADLKTYSLAVTVSTGTVTSTSGTVTNSGSNVWTVTEVTAGTNITLKVTDIAGCENAIVVTSPNCSCPLVLPPNSGGDKSYCASGTIPSINATVLTGETVDWYNSPSGGTLLNSGSLSYTPTNPGTYYALTRNSITGCMSNTRTSITVTMNPLPTATASNNGPITPGSPLSLTGGPGGMTTYAWTGPNSFTSASQSPTVSTSATTDMAGVYTLTVTNSNGCQNSATTTVTSNPFIVTNVNDNGIGSLRFAIDNANSTVNVKEVITFDIPGSGPFTLRPGTPLPEITNPVIIDGYSQPGASAKDLILLIEIDGTNAGSGSNGLSISGGNCTVKGLIINRFSGDGIQITGSGTNSILGNFIGVDFSGTVPKGNAGDGIQIDGSSNNQIGGTSLGEGNVISGNNGAGISILNTGAIGNQISSNSIYSNGGIGIDLGGNGVTNNDTGDPDNGPNYLQNFPVLGSANFSTGSVTISGSLNSVGSKVYNLQFFASKLADNSGNGEGQYYLGSKTVTTNSTGDAVFTQAFSIKSSWGTVITATATDNLGNTSEFSKTIGGFQDQTVGQWPLIYTLNKDGVPNITDGTDLNAIRASFQTWSAIPTANIQFTEAGTTTSNKYANASDGVNLVSFGDDQFPFSYGVLAVAAKTLQIDPNTQVARIIDADIVVNPDFVNDIKYNLGVGYNNKNAGYFDIQSVITHEIGHVLGLLHTGVVGSTMFFTLNSGTKVRTLEQDDKSWASYGYPKQPIYNTTYGSISGNITYGYGGQPVAGALVYAISATRQDSVHGYSDASGNYTIPGLIPGSYYVYIEPLDGNVNGYNLRPANISSYIYSNTVYTDYPGEFYNSPDLAIEPDDSKSAVTVNAGSTSSGINLITNTDNIHPTVVSVSPTDISAGLINISSNFSIKFSEAIDETSLTTGTCYLTGGIKTIGGSYTILGNNVILFDPETVLGYSTNYTLHITQGVKDLRANTLQPEFTQSFTTIPQDSNPPTINEVIPANGATNVFVSDKIRVFFSEPMNKASVESGFTLNWTDASGSKTAGGSFSWANDDASFAYTPSGSLRENTVYTITLANSITDLSGIHMVNNESRTFTTVAQAQVIIQYLGPGNGNTSVPVTTPVVVDFSEPIDPSTVNSATFKLHIGNTNIPGTFEFLNENSRVVFRPDANLSFNQAYSVTLTSGIQDVSLPTSSNLSASITTFRTAVKLTVPSILYLEPSSGVVGNVVTITGTGFDPNPVNNTITFNGISAPVTKASLTSLTTEVPMGALSGPVEVKVNGTVSDNTMYFYIIPETLAPCDDIIDNKSTGSSTSHDADITEAVSVSGVLNTYAYITNPGQGTVSVLNLTSNETISQITVGNTPMKIDINPQGTKAYVTNFNSHTVSVINLVKGSTYNQVIATIPVGIEPYGVAVTPDGKRVYVANYYSGNLSVIDEDPNSGGFDHVVANVSTGSSSGNVVVTADAGMVLVTGDFGLKIVNSNPADKDYNSVIANVSSGTKTTDVTATADAGLAIVSTADGHLLVVNLRPENGDYSEAVIANVSTGSKGSDVEASADNMFVYVTDTDHNQILVYQIGPGGSGTANGSGVTGLTLIPHNVIPVPNAPVALAINADASRLYVIDTPIGSVNREITTIAICCGPISPTKAIGDLIITIQTMINKGDIPKLRGYALIITLNSALRDIYANRTRLAIADLNAFKLLVNAYIKNKQISSAQGNALVKSITAIITQLNSSKSGESETYASDRERSNQDLISRSKLGVIYPNPFSQSVTIDYEIAEKSENLSKVLIKVYDISGQLVSTLVDKMMQPGSYSTSWKGNYDHGGTAPYGTYFLLFRSGNVEEVQKIMLIKPR